MLTILFAVTCSMTGIYASFGEESSNSVEFNVRMVDYPKYALNLQNYFERHLIERPEWRDAVEVARSWQLEMRKETHQHGQLAELEDAARGLSAPGTAVEELQMMVGKWITEARAELESPL